MTELQKYVIASALGIGLIGYVFGGKRWAVVGAVAGAAVPVAVGAGFVGPAAALSAVFTGR